MTKRIKKTPKTAEELFDAAVEKMLTAGIGVATFAVANELLPFNKRVIQLQQALNQEKTKVTHMLALVTYDIEDNRIRRNIAKYLIRKGMVRLQKSVFFANLPRKTLLEVKATIEKINAMYNNNDSILILPIPDDYINKLTCIGKDLAIEVFIKPKNTIFI